MTTSLSSTWAVRQALLCRRAGDVDEDVLFGLGGMAWYWTEPLAGAPAVLHAYHPDRIKNCFFALNVQAVRFDYLDEGGLEELHERASQGAQTIIQVNRFALPDWRGALDKAGVCEVALIVHSSVDASLCGGLQVQGPWDAQPWFISDEDLLRAWFLPRRRGPVATFFWHPVRQLQWDRPRAMRRALRSHLAQMRERYPTLGPTGLDALAAVRASVKGGDLRAIEMLACRAQADGGTGLGRHQLSRFLEGAARPLQAPMLMEAARHARECAQTWQQLLDSVLTHGARGSEAMRALRSITALEHRQLECMQQAFHRQEQELTACVS